MNGWYRGTGADLPFGDPLPAHPGVAMEGYFWRFTQPDEGRVIIALIGVNRAADGSWSTLGLASYDLAGSTRPGGSSLVTVAHPEGEAGGTRRNRPGPRLHARAGSAFVGDDDRLVVDLGPEARLDLTIHEPVHWPRAAFGGSGPFHAVPALNQYWHPWLLGGRAEGVAVVGGERWEIRGAQAYGEKNWGREGFPESWWWGQAQGFAEPGACVAFAGGQVTAGPLRTEVTALVVRLPDGQVVRLGNPGTSPVRARVSDDRWSLRGRSLRWEIEVEGRAPLEQAHVLPVPLPSERRNTAGALEHLAGTMEVRVRRRGRTVWEGASSLAALEHGGLERAEAELRRRGIPQGATDAAPRVTGQNDPRPD